MTTSQSGKQSKEKSTNAPMQSSQLMKLKEGNEIIEECEEGAMCDAGIISAGQKFEHYEIASYGTLRQFAETLELSKAVDLLEQTLNEEKAADQKLSEIAVTVVNVQAAEQLKLSFFAPKKLCGGRTVNRSETHTTVILERKTQV